nr:hydroxymethylbilane synthase [candidate division Zixibacteria bacterium]
MPKKKFKVGTRGSRLAVAQTGWVLDLLKKNNPEAEFQLVTITTAGDTDRISSLEHIGGSGVFTKKIESELLDGSIDIAVHSAKDLPSVMTEGLMIGAIPPRESCEDVWVSRLAASIANTARNSIVGTGSPRRRAQLLYLRPDIRVKDIRGNIETRLKKLARGEYDAIIMARAGLKRGGLDYNIHEVLPPAEFVPAPGQGALLVQIRTGDKDAAGVTAPLNDSISRRCLMIERKLLEILKAGCAAAVGGWARLETDEITLTTELRLTAVVLDKDGKTRLYVDGSIAPDQPDEILINRVADRLIAEGAREIIANYDE